MASPENITAPFLFKGDMDKPKRLPHLKLSLLSKFSLISFLLMAAIAFVLGWGIQRHLEKSSLEQEAENAGDHVATFLKQNLRLADFSGPLDPNRCAQIDNLIRQNILGRHIVRVKIWNRDGLVVYSDAKDLVGRRFPVEGELREALAGKIAMEISDLRKEENVAERGPFSRLMEIYVPLRPMDSPQVVGAYEIYHDLSPLESHLTGLRRFIWASMGLGFVLLYGLLFTIVSKASRELIRRGEENARLYENAKRAEAEIQRNYDTQTMINSILRLSLEDISLEEILRRALDIILAIPWLAFDKRGCIFLVEDPPEVLVMKAQSNLSKEIQTSCAQVPFGKCLCGRASMSQEIYFADCIDESHEIYYEGIIPHGHYCAPITFGSRTLGVLNIYVREGHVHNQREEEFLSGITNTLAGIILRNQAQKEMAILQEQLRQSQKMEAIGQLAGGIAHDFNNVLTIMKGQSQLALMDLKKGDQFWDVFQSIEEATTKAANLVRQILAFSRRQVMEMVVLDLNNLLRNLEKMFRRIIGENIELLTVLVDDLGRVKADPGQIEQVVLNLAINARDAMPQGGKLTIETANVELDEAYARRHVAVKPGRYVMIAVSDTGVGMTPEIKRRIFEPFFTTKEKGKGTGLGLATVYGIVKQSGGNIWVYSEPGQGTTFKIYLPLVDEPLAKEREKEEIGLFSGSGVILVVEDEKGVRKLVLEMLKKQGYSVLEAGDGEEALLIGQRYKDTIHLMVTDVVMPKISGPELAKRLVVFHPEMKVLYMSGYADGAVAHRGVLEKGMNFIQKPFTVEGFERKIRGMMDKDSKAAI